MDTLITSCWVIVVSSLRISFIRFFYVIFWVCVCGRVVWVCVCVQPNPKRILKVEDIMNRNLARIDAYIYNGFERKELRCTVVNNFEKKERKEENYFKWYARACSIILVHRRHSTKLA